MGKENGDEATKGDPKIPWAYENARKNARHLIVTDPVPGWAAYVIGALGVPESAGVKFKAAVNVYRPPSIHTLIGPVRGIERT